MNRLNRPVTPGSLVRALSAECHLYAQAALRNLYEVIEEFRDGNLMGAIEAYEGTTELIAYLDVNLKRIVEVAKKEVAVRRKTKTTETD